MERRVRQDLSMSFYGALLTVRQREILALTIEEDLSLSEIAEAEGITRQAVHDTVRKAEKQLAVYEAKLGLVQRFERIRQTLYKVQESLSINDTNGAQALVDMLITEEETHGV